MNASTTTLTAERVRSIFMECLLKDDEDTSNHIVAEGIVQTAMFSPGRIEKHRGEIHNLIDQLPDEFKVGGGDGSSFLNACLDRHGRHWGEHPDIEQLVQLGIAIGEISYILPREMWSIFPGGMPYFVVTY